MHRGVVIVFIAIVWSTAALAAEKEFIACNDDDDVPSAAPIAKYVPETYRGTDSRMAGEFDVEIDYRREEGADEGEERFAVRLFVPVRKQDDATIIEPGPLTFLNVPNSTVIVWSNGTAGVDCQDKYKELLTHWASYGFLVVQEGALRRPVPRLIQRWPFGTRGPRESYLSFAEWLTEKWDETGRANEEIPNFRVIVAGKSRGGSQSHAAARDEIFEHLEKSMLPRKISGLICLAGCGFPGSNPAEVPGLYIAGKRDRVLLVINARRNVCNAYRRRVTDASFFVRQVVKRDGKKDKDFGTHLGHDNDPLIRLLTTDWLRCKRGNKHDKPACKALQNIETGDVTWSLAALSRNGLPENSCG